MADAERDEKYDRIASSFSQRDYANPTRYAERRAKVIVELGPALAPGDRLLDLGCGDAMMAEPFARHGIVYSGVDASTGMIETARSRHPGLSFEVARFEDYAPPEPVDAAICLRAVNYVEDPPAFFRLVASYTRKKLVFDFRAGELEPRTTVRQLREAGFARVELRPFFLPQLRQLPDAAVPLVFAFEQAGPLARLATRWYGRMFCAAAR